MKDQDEQYRTDANLRVRVQTHQRYTVGPDLEPAIDAALSLRRHETLVDVGTGYGEFPARLRASGHASMLVGIDMQPGMLDEARRRHGDRVSFVRGDLQRLPLADESADVVCARHMLYHVADIPLGLGEARRVLRRGGQFLAVTNARDNMAEFWAVVAEVGQRFPALRRLTDRDGPLKFTDENAAALIGDAFGNFEEHRLLSRLEFPSHEPVERYFRSCLPGFDIADPDAAAAVFRKVLHRRWPAAGPWTVAKTIVIYTATKHA